MIIFYYKRWNNKWNENEISDMQKIEFQILLRVTDDEFDFYIRTQLTYVTWETVPLHLVISLVHLIIFCTSLMGTEY